MSTNENTNKRIARNTVFLYIRMLLQLLVGLYTVRVVLDTLGVEDYGIYNVVAGFVTSFSFLANTTSTAINRFLAYSIGRNDMTSYIRYFKNSFVIFFYLAIIALVLAETIGLWFVMSQLVIPTERMESAIWVYESACISLLISFFLIPFTAVIISYERMQIFAYIGLSDVTLKLGIVFLLQIMPYDSLKTYAVLMVLVSIINFSITAFFAYKTNNDISISIKGEKRYVKSLLSFTGWNLFGSVSGLCRSQGINVLINIFFGPVCNAARGIAYQIYGVINNFANNFMMAVNPQIIKLYASNSREEMEKLVHRSSKVSYSLLGTLSYPVYVLMPFILDIWLKNVPEYTVIFSRLCLINMLVESVSIPLLTLAQATGKVKVYQVVVGGLLILNLPISWFLFKYLQADAYCCFIVMITLNIIALFLRLLILGHTAGISVWAFTKDVVTRFVFLIAVMAIGFTYTINSPIAWQIANAIIGVVLIPMFCFAVMFTSREKKKILSFVYNKIKR